MTFFSCSFVIAAQGLSLDCEQLNLSKTHWDEKVASFHSNVALALHEPTVYPGPLGKQAEIPGMCVTHVRIAPKT